MTAFNTEFNKDNAILLDFNPNNLILKSDSYKNDHWEMIPAGAQYLYSYGESRGSDQYAVRGVNEGYTYTVFVGLQAILKRHFSGRLTMQDVDEAEELVELHMGPNVFNRKGWEAIVTKFKGRLPLRIRCLKEGTIVPTGNVLWTVENTHPDFAWLVSYFEPLFLQAWYPITVASVSYSIRQVVEQAFRQSVDEGVGSQFKLHDFGFRGVSSVESARIGGAAHLMAGWMGTDTIQAIIELKQYYGVKKGEMPAFSVRATEHSVVCANSNAETRDDSNALEMAIQLLEKHKGIVACVGDTYSIRRFAEWCATDPIKTRIMNSGGTFVLRPDSGNPLEIPVEIIGILMAGFGYTVNSKGYKVLPDCIRVLQGDGINESSIRGIYDNMFKASRMYSADNIVFGMGGALLQHCDRDWLKFAMKASALCVNGIWVDLYKDPDTDSVKRSKKGRVTTYKDSNGKYFSDRIELQETNHTIVDQMVTVWEDGDHLVEWTFGEIRIP